MWWFVIVIVGVLLYAFLIDWRRKKNNNNPLRPTNPHAKKGEDSNYMKGDNKDTGGFH
ncbi:hypothetical protein ABE096_06345 [Robertmurraya massiliosenegalensis]|uniref:hypothetical protein n=1 Tax=Robertmurraya TaxID=2837507 RepID=UPI0039A6F589